MFARRICALGLVCLLAACVTSKPSDLFPTPPVWSTGQPATPPAIPVIVATPTQSYTLPPRRLPGSAEMPPTPDAPHYQAGAQRGPETYVVQADDMLSAIAERYSVSVQALVEANQLANPDVLEPGQTLTIPAVTPQAPGPSYKLIPDSELVYGPLSGTFDIQAFIQSKHGYLANYTDVVNGETVTADRAVQLAAQSFSVSPRLLLALLQYCSGWVTNPNPDPALGDPPFGINDGFHIGLYKQLVWAASNLNNGYYRWRSGTATNWVLADGSVVPIDPTINAGTAGVQYFFAQLDDYPTWLRDVTAGGFYDVFYLLFGNPFDLAIEPLVPVNLSQPRLHLPFAAGETWYFTGGPHASYDFGSPWGALDFGPPDANGCEPSTSWVTAMADGLVTRTGLGTVIQDLDGDGNEGSGWVLLYYHVESRDRVQPGTSLHAGDPIGHPSCEGGEATGAHVHIARKFNGVWLAVLDPSAPFVMDGWVPAGTGEEYVGTLTRNGKTVEKVDGMSESNQIQR